MNPTPFPTPAHLHHWFQHHHATTPELWALLYKTNSPQPSVTLAQLKDEALCFGWAEAIRKKIDEHSYAIRFCPRKPRSAWSERNVKRFQELEALGLVHPAGQKAFAERDLKKSSQYSAEKRNQPLSPEFLEQFEDHPSAMMHFETMAPSYQQLAIFWVMRAKQAKTRQKRMDILLECSAVGKKIPPLRRPGE